MTAMTTPLGDRFSAMLDQCARERRLAFLLHLTLGDPSPEASLPLLETLAEAGADAFELAIPFSDPTADGPVLEESAHRALDAGTTVEKCFSLVRTFREKHPNVPLSLATYVNIAVAPGLERFFQSAAAAGFDAAALRDLPLAMREAEPEWNDAARGAGIGLAASVSGASCQRSLSGIAKQRSALPFQFCRSALAVPVRSKRRHPCCLSSRKESPQILKKRARRVLPASLPARRSDGS